jgi:hypothetical protein
MVQGKRHFPNKNLRSTHQSNVEAGFSLHLATSIISDENNNACIISRKKLSYPDEDRDRDFVYSVLD